LCADCATGVQGDVLVFTTVTRGCSFHTAAIPPSRLADVVQGMEHARPSLLMGWARRAPRPPVAVQRIPSGAAQPRAAPGALGKIWVLTRAAVDERLLRRDHARVQTGTHHRRDRINRVCSGRLPDVP